MKNHRSTLIGFVMLVVLMGAGAAQGLAGSNTVFGDDIVDGTITTPDLKTGALSGSKILDNSVTGVDINPARQTVFQGWMIEAGQYQSGEAVCPVGKTATGGGFTQDEAGLLTITDSFRGDARTWVVWARNTTGNNLPLDVSVTCDAL